jgi:hypothetical protein
MKMRMRRNNHPKSLEGHWSTAETSTMGWTDQAQELGLYQLSLVAGMVKTRRLIGNVTINNDLNRDHLILRLRIEIHMSIGIECPWLHLDHNMSSDLVRVERLLPINSSSDNSSNSNNKLLRIGSQSGTPISPPTTE